MKKFLCSIFVLISLAAFAQTLPVKNGNIEFEKVDSVKGTKEQLYLKSKRWVVNTFKSANSVIQMDDKENAQIIGKGNFDFYYKYALTTIENTCLFSFQIDCKDNKYRIRIYDMSIETGTMHISASIDYYVKKQNKNPYNKVISEVYDHTNALIQSFNSAMNSETKDDF